MTILLIEYLFSGNTCYMNATIQCLKVRSTLVIPFNIGT
jgi:ubiquitin C-terminal hydrolase